MKVMAAVAFSAIRQTKLVGESKKKVKFQIQTSTSAKKTSGTSISTYFTALYNITVYAGLHTTCTAITQTHSHVHI